MGDTWGDLEGLNAGAKDVFVRLLDGNGTVVWTRRIGAGGTIVWLRTGPGARRRA